MAYIRSSTENPLGFRPWQSRLSGLGAMPLARLPVRWPIDPWHPPRRRLLSGLGAIVPKPGDVPWSNSYVPTGVYSYTRGDGVVFLNPPPFAVATAYYQYKDATTGTIYPAVIATADNSSVPSSAASAVTPDQITLVPWPYTGTAATTPVAVTPVVAATPSFFDSLPSWWPIAAIGLVFMMMNKK